MKQTTNIRKAVCAIANQLRKTGLSLSSAFRAAWKKVKLQMVVRVSGVTFSNIQERLRFLSQFRPQDLTVSLEREADNSFDTNAIKVRVHIPAIRKQTEIGYIPALVAGELAKAIDIGCEIKATFKGVIGGYDMERKPGRTDKYFRIRRDVMPFISKEELDAMADKIAEELGLGSEKFIRGHLELMQMIDEAERKQQETKNSPHQC